MKIDRVQLAGRFNQAVRRLAGLTCLAFALTSVGCVVANPYHCVNRDTDGNAWCKAQDGERPFCNPCSAANDGCQATEPQLSNPREDDFCFEYVSPGTTTGAPTTSATDGDSGSGGDTSGGDTSGGNTSGA